MHLCIPRTLPFCSHFNPSFWSSCSVSQCCESNLSKQHQLVHPCQNNGNNFKRMYGGFPFLFDLFIACLKYWISPYVVSCQFLSEQFVWSFRPVQRNQVYVHIVKFKLENLQIQANPHAQWWNMFTIQKSMKITKYWIISFFSIEINSMSYSYKCIAECLIYGVDKNTRNRLVFIIRKADHGCRGNSRDPPTAH